MTLPTQPDRILPDLRICRAVKLTERLSECQVTKPTTCEFAMPFGYGFLCGHPERSTILANTLTSRKQNSPAIAKQTTAE